MNRIIKSILLVFIILITACNQDKKHNGLSQYQNIDSVSEFAPNLWIKGNTFKGSFSEDYKTFYFFRKIAPNIEKYLPYQSNFNNGKWEDPQIIDYYDEKYSYTYQLKVPNTNVLYFISNKRTNRDTSQVPNYNFWKTEKVDNKYSKPMAFDYNNLMYNYNSQPCITNNGTLYCTSDSPDWSKTFSYKMERINGKYAKPKLFEPINNWRKNKDWKVFEFCVSPKEDYLIVCIQDQINDTLSTDLYISYFKNSLWTYPKRLNNEINSSETENFPTITNDGKYLIFTKSFSEFKIISTKKID